MKKVHWLTYVELDVYKVACGRNYRGIRTTHNLGFIECKDCLKVV